MKFDNLSNRLKELEDAQGYVALDDGSRYRFGLPGSDFVVASMAHTRDTGRLAVLSDFTAKQQAEIAAYANWTPDPALHGQISAITCKLAREIVARS